MDSMTMVEHRRIEKMWGEPLALTDPSGGAYTEVAGKRSLGAVFFCIHRSSRQLLCVLVD